MQAKLKLSTYATREDWLNALADIYADIYFNGSFAPELPKCRFSCGFPKGRSKAIGQCFAAESSADHTFEIFVSPELADPFRVADVLLHECVHAAVGIECGHKGAFRKTATLCGLGGSMKATVATDELTERLKPILDDLGPYPHAALSSANRPKKDGTRMLKLVCDNEECGMVIRTTKKWIEEVGEPTCACGGSFALEEPNE